MTVAERRQTLEPCSLWPRFPRPVSDHVPLISYDAELKRKALHLGALVMPLGLLVLGRTGALVVLVPLALIAVFCDVARLRWAWMHRFIGWVFGPIMRPEEQPAFGGPLVLNGATWMCVSAALCAALFPEPIAAAALVMLMVGDGAAAVLGRRYGRTKWPGSPKSVEGSLAYAVTAFAIGLAVVAWPGTTVSVGTVAVGAVVGAAVEALPLPLNDNMRVPFLSGLAMAAALAVL